MAPVLWTPESVAGVGAVAEPRWAPDGARLAWVRATPLGVVLVVDGVAVPDLVPAGTRGGTYSWEDADHLVVVGDGGLHRVRRDGRGPGLLVAPAAGSRRGAGGVCALGPRGLHRRDRRVLPGDGGAPRRVPGALAGVARPTSPWDPAWSPDGRRLAWHEWDEPDMPWDGSRIVVGSLDDGSRTVVAGGANESVGQPRFAPGPGPARLACVRDRDGWANVVVTTADGRAAVAFAEPHEHAEPTWGPGQRSFAWSPDGARIAWCRNEDGFGRLVVAPVRGLGNGGAGDGDGQVGGAPEEWSKGWHHGLDWGPAGLACVRSGARTPPSVVVLTARSSAPASEPVERRVVEMAVGADAAMADAGVEPRPVTWAGDDGATVHGLLFSPPGVAAPPLLVHLHGGPTDQSRVEWSPRLQYWVARGWAVLAPNPRGSTGYGRDYAQALRGGWGDRDVADVLAGIRAAVAAGWGDGTRVALVGGSAGGYAALLVAVRAPDLVRAVVASYPVTDLAALAADTHRFERHYNDSLVGPLPGAAPAWRDRSPIGPTPPRCGSRSSCSRATPIRSSRSPNRWPSSTPCAPPVATSSSTSTRGRGTAGSSRPRSADALSPHRRVPHPEGAVPMTTYAYQGPKRGFDRAVLLAHGAGTDLDAAPLRAVADALADGEDPVAALQLPVPRRGAQGARPTGGPARRHPRRGRRARPADEAARSAAGDRRPLHGRPVLLAGRRRRRRIRCRCVGLLLLGYPLHAAGKPEKVRDDHFRRLTVPTLFVSGTRDSLAAQPDLTRSARKVEGEGLVVLARHRRPRLQAPEVQRSYARRHARPRRPRPRSHGCSSSRDPAAPVRGTP